MFKYLKITFWVLILNILSHGQLDAVRRRQEQGCFDSMFCCPCIILAAGLAAVCQSCCGQVSATIKACGNAKCCGCCSPSRAPSTVRNYVKVSTAWGSVEMSREGGADTDPFCMMFAQITKKSGGRGQNCRAEGDEFDIDEKELVETLKQGVMAHYFWRKGQTSEELMVENIAEDLLAGLKVACQSNPALSEVLPSILIELYALNDCYPVSEVAYQVCKKCDIYVKKKRKGPSLSVGSSSSDGLGVGAPREMEC